MAVSLRKPYWCHHNERIINAVHVHPDGSRLVTCGGDNSIRIWAVASLVEGSAELDTAKPKILAQLDNHTNVVNCVRWSPDGENIASGSVDQSVMIWYLATGQAEQFDREVKNVENWKCLCNLTGHSADVQDLAWDPSSTYVASSSVDNSIIVWKRRQGNFERHRTLNGHTDFVKGLAWDPKGKYLASQSADGTMIMWRVSDWKQERVFKDNFRPQSKMLLKFHNDVNRQVVFSRPSWSPTGTFLAAAGGVSKNDVFISPVYERGSWTHEVSFVGHDRATTVTLFNPKLFVNKGEDVGDSKNHFFLAAVGGLDNRVTVWSTHATRAVMVFEETFREAVLDLAWSPCGYRLFAVSHDGSVLVVTFSEDAIGSAVPSKVASSMEGTLVVDPAILKVLQQRAPEVLEEVEEEEEEQPAKSIEMPPQKEMVVNGRRKIIPVRLPSPKKQKKVKRRIQPTFLMPSNGSSSPNPSKPKNSASKPSAAPSTKLLDRLGLENAQSGFDSLPDPKPKNNSNNHSKSNHTSPKNKRKGLELSSQKRIQPSPKKAKFSAIGPSPPVVVVDSSPEANNNKRKRPSTPNDLTTPSPKRARHGMLPFAPALLREPAQLTAKKFLSTQLSPASPNKPAAVLEAKVITRQLFAGERHETHITSKLGEDKVVWRGEVPGFVTALAGNHHLSAVATLEGDLFLFSKQGGYLDMPVRLPSELVHLDVNSSHQLLGVTNQGKGYVWQLNPIPGETCRLDYQFDLSPLLRTLPNSKTQPAFALAWITDRGKVLVSLASRKVFLLNRTLGGWSAVSDGTGHWGSQIVAGSIRPRNAPPPGKRPKTLQDIQHKFAPERFPFDLANLPEKDSLLHTIGFMEHQIAMARGMGQREEFKTWVSTYFTFLADSVVDDESLKDRLEELCQRLLCPSQATGDDKGDPSGLTTRFKRGILREEVPRLTTNPSLQGLVSRLLKDLKELDESEKPEAALL